MLRHIDNLEKLVINLLSFKDIREKVVEKNPEIQKLLKNTDLYEKFKSGIYTN
jgi:hypothetical protein